jgi:hypothetical protein
MHMRSRQGLLVAGAAVSTLALSVAAQTATSPAQAAVATSSRVCVQPDGRVSASTISSGVLYIGGRFTHVSDLHGVSKARGGLAAVNLSTCDLLPWTAVTNGDVHALTVAGGSVYAGGEFTTVGGLTRTRLAALDASSGDVLPFKHTVNRTVRALTVSGSTVFAGGDFSTVDGAGRAGLAGFATGSGALSSTWRPTASGSVRTLTPSATGGRIYVGGSFRSLDGSSADAYLGAVDSAGGALDTAFKPHATFPILDLVSDSRGVYAGGGGSGGHLGIWNADGSLQRPVYQTDGDVQAIAVSGDSLYAGGHFDNYCVANTGSGAPYLCTTPRQRKKLFEVSLASGAVTSWAPSLNSNLGVFSATTDPGSGQLYIGGDFTTINSAKRAHLGAFAAG